MKGGNGAQEKMRKLKTHLGVALSMFSDMRDVAQSPMAQAIIKRLNLERPIKAKYLTLQTIVSLRLDKRFHKLRIDEPVGAASIVVKAVVMQTSLLILIASRSIQLAITHQRSEGVIS
ncbi:MAG: hypothetical protein EZS28_029588 [Streblomastix strix]|uniref:Uncharacterized protein n=1 Tax=Streblomastix strix TaxID=222440 RepID=A0A5J4UYR4_9EUKA|nr:MAG: hypothetical protein EZS28_029588 [Streblomastix strix]